MNKYIMVVIMPLFFSLAGCGKKGPKTGLWRGEIHTQGQRIPFHFELQEASNGDYQVSLINGAEKFVIDSVSVHGDSIEIPVLIFDAYITASFQKRKMSGEWVKPYATDYRLPFKAEYGKKHRFISDGKAKIDVTGKWEVQITDSRGTSPAIGVFEQTGSRVTGSFLTNHGDYRYLEGAVDGDSLFLSLFDGTNAYLFKAKAEGSDLLSGEFFSGITGYRTWTGRRNEQARLADPDKLTAMKEGFATIDFTFPDLNGNMVSSDDERFKEKVVLVQILGSWCINCMDETKFLAQWYKENQDKPVEIVGLAFERKDDVGYARQQLSRYIKRFDVRYPILFAGANNRDNLDKAFPTIDRVSAFPTTIFLDKNKNVRKIHTGFTGPGTGKYYEEFVKEFNAFMDELIME
jgi:thiol-disulfide isomerase/thioredoxin